jgi:hypothetical protein
VIRVIHGVAGVDAVRVGRLHRAGEPAILNSFLTAASPRAGSPPGGPAAEILTVAHDGANLEVGW